jgi:NAD+-dependent protein deacetylase sirtuin 5
LNDFRCTSFYCNYSTNNDFTDPLVPALAIPTQSVQPEPSRDNKTGEEATKALYEAMASAKNDQEQAKKELDISDPVVPIPTLQVKDLPKCPECGGLLRPGVVWFGESLPSHTLDTIDEWIETSPQIDLMLVIGTSSKVWPAAGYVDIARDKGARVAVVNMDRNDTPGGADGLEPGDWFFEGDASEIVPELLKSVTGEI